MSEILIEPPKSQAASGIASRRATYGVAACGIFVMPAYGNLSHERAQELSKRAPVSEAATWEIRRSASSSAITVADLPPIARVEATLKAAGLVPTGTAMTVDDSKLFEFVDEARVGVDVHPTGEIVVMVRKERGTDYYDLDASKPALLVSLLQDVGVQRNV